MLTRRLLTAGGRRKRWSGACCNVDLRAVRRCRVRAGCADDTLTDECIACIMGSYEDESRRRGGAESRRRGGAESRRRADGGAESRRRVCFVIYQERLSTVLSLRPIGDRPGQWYSGHTQYVRAWRARSRGATGTSDRTWL